MHYDKETLIFSTSLTQVKNFKKDHHISRRKVTLYVKFTEQRSLEELQVSTAQFQNEIQNTLPAYNLDLVINTDQMGVECHTNVYRIHEHNGDKAVNVCLGDVNKVTHTHTAQYTITAFGRFVNKVLLCLQ